MNTKKTIITTRSVLDGNHYFIVHDSVQDAFRTAQKLHLLGENKYIQVRFRSTIPSLRTYIKLNNLSLIGA